MNKFYIAIQINLLILLTFTLVGCPPIELSHPTLVAKDTFAADPSWPEKQVCYVFVLTPDRTSENADKIILPALTGPCCDGASADPKQLQGYTIVWAAKADTPVSANGFRIIPGIVPEGFILLIPIGPLGITFDPDEKYFILICLNPVDNNFYSIAAEWQPGQEIPLLRGTEIVDTDGPFRHEASGMLFHTHVAGFTRGEIRNYDNTRCNTGITYNLKNPDAPITATVYIYPASPDSPNFDFEEAKKSVLQYRRNARLIRQESAALGQNNIKHTGQMASFEYEDIFTGRMQLLKSYLYVFSHPGGKWIIKYRFTNPKDVNSEEFIREFMSALIWPVENPK